MSFKEFDMSEIEKAKKEYAAEVEERWGDTDAYAESAKKTAGYGKEDWKNIGEAGDVILAEFGKCRNLEPGCEEAQALVKRWQDHITASFYHCSKEILAGLGQMYVGDERFTKNIDKHGEGTAQFMADAIAIYCTK